LFVRVGCGLVFIAHVLAATPSAIGIECLRTSMIARIPRNTVLIDSRCSFVRGVVVVISRRSGGIGSDRNYGATVRTRNTGKEVRKFGIADFDVKVNLRHLLLLICR